MTEALWTVDDLIVATGADADGVDGAAITGFSIDTRSLSPGEVFVALTDQRDGHAFVGNAFKVGAAAALVKRDYDRGPADGLLLRVEDPLAALAAIGCAARDRLGEDARVVAVTGSAGKTTTKEMLRACFEAMTPGKVHASVKSFNNHWGVPLTLARMPADTEFAVFEIGMNHAGEIRPLSRMVRPHVALVTTVAPAHLGHFKSVEEIADAKAEIFVGLDPDTGLMAAVLPVDNPHYVRLAEAAAAASRVAGEGVFPAMFTFGTGGDADIRVETETSSFAPDGSRVVLTVMDEFTFTLPLNVAGRHNAVNAAACVATVLAATSGTDHDPFPPDEGDPGVAFGALGRMQLDPEGRGQIHNLPGGPILIDESYNANPASVRAALDTLALYPRALRRVVVLGDMLELGDEADALHRALADDVVAAGVDCVIACGPHMWHMFDALPSDKQGGWHETSEGIRDLVVGVARDGDVVMVKGSLGSRMAPLTAALKARYRQTPGGTAG